MANIAPQPSQMPPQDTEPPEPADNNFYTLLSIAFLVGMVFLFGLFILMMVMLAGAK